MNKLKMLGLLLCMATIQIVIAQSTSVAVTDNSSQPAYRSGMIYLKLKDNAQIYLPKFKRGDKFDNYPLLTPFMNSYGISKIYRPFEKTKGIAFQHTYRVEFNPTADVEKLIRELAALGVVEYAEKIPAEYICFDPNDPKDNDGSLWFLDKVKAYQAWDLTQGSGNVVAAVIDDAVYISHEDLIANLWVNSNEIAGNGIDDDGNGYIDDINGVDVADDDGNPSPPAALVSPTVFSHGSHCAGILGSVTNNGVGVASISSHIKVMGIKATRDATSSPGMIEAGWEGIQYAVAEGATIISLSWGGTSNSQTYQNLINSFEAQGVLIFAAAGNSNIETPFYPAAYNYVVGVGASDQSDYKASYSNYGSWVDIMAPGSYIHGILCTSSSNYGIKSGTSMATPMAASLAGLMKSYNPAITPAELRTCMYNSADNLNTLNPTYVGKMGAGRINAQNAVVCALPSACITPYNLTTSNIVGTSAQLNWSGTSGSTYTVQAREVGTASWGTYSASATSYTLPVSTCKNYEFKVMANCGASGSSSYSAVATFSTTVGGSQNYCTQPAPSASFGWVQNVQFAGISNNSGNNNGYSNATCSVGSVTSGTSYPITLSPGFNSYAYNEYWRVYIDYNQDGDFLDTGELAYESGTSSTTTVNGNIVIPNTALSGNTRMRVMMKWFGTGDMSLPVPCTAYNYGEVEEYTINIGSAVQSCLAPNSTATNSITASGATLSWAAVSGTTTYPVQYKATSSNTWITVNAANTSSTLSGLTASTTYEWKVAASCGVYSTPLTFTTSAAAVACSTPSSATVTSITSTTVGLSWSSVSGASNYAVRCRVLNGTWSPDLTSTSNTATLSQLSPATSYEYQVKTNCASGVSAYSASVNFITATPSCNAPSSLATSNLTTSSLTFNWGAVTGGLNYTVRYRVNGSTTWTTMASTSATTQTISGLAATTTYELQVGSTCSGATVNYATSITATTATPCGTPNTLTANSITSSGATLSWAAVTAATTYTIQYKTSSSTTWSSTTSTTTSKSLTGLVAATAYNFKVMSTCSSGSSAYSAVSTFTTTSTNSCGIPSGVVANSITASNATISWAAISGATSYTIQYKLASGTIWSSTTSTTNTKLLVGLVASTTYNVKVMSTCSSGISAYSAIINFTTSAAATCGMPSGVTASGISSTGATINWTAVSGSTGYTIQYKASSATTWASTTSTTVSKALTGLVAATAYDVKVMSTCSGGSSAYTTIINFTTSAAAATCGVPTGLAMGSIATTTAVVNWTAVSGATQYTIQYKLASSTIWSSTTTTSNTKLLMGLVAGTAYNVKVMSTCSVGNSAYSSIVNFNTLPGTLSFNGLAYCEPSNNTANTQWINEVSFADIENYSANNNGYGDFSILNTEVVRGNTYTIDLQANNGNNAQWQIWIDYDQDGVFDNSTELVASQEGASTSAQITIPTAVYVGEARMRIALGNNTNACENTNGETEDYTLYIKPQNPIADLPNNFIESVSLNNQSYTSANQGRFNKATFSVQQGVTYSLTLTAAYVQNTPAFWLIQIDYNNNGTYTDQGETLTVAANGNQTVITQLTVPTNANLTDANIKINLQHIGSSQAFVTDETEQYALTILEATKNIALNNKMCDDIAVSFNYSVEDNKVVFENTSTGKYNDLWWQFGDGSTNTDANPEHTYSKTGDYDISLTISNTTTGCRQTFNAKVFITNSTAMFNNND